MSEESNCVILIIILNSVVTKDTSCHDGDVGLLVDHTPMIFLNGSWIPICSAEFAKNDYGATLFCKKLDFTSGKPYVKYDVKNVLDSFMIGKCNCGDIWPNCRGGCNWKTIGHRCYPDESDLHTFTDCGRERRPKLFIQCSGPKVHRNIYSCSGI